VEPKPQKNPSRNTLDTSLRQILVKDWPQRPMISPHARRGQIRFKAFEKPDDEI
jgi:hypothetical protein